MKRNLFVLAFAAILFAGLFGNSTNPKAVRASGCNGVAVTNALTPAGSCIAAALISGQVNFSNPSQAVVQVAQICVGVTAESIFAAIMDIINSASQIADGGTIGAPIPAAPLVTVEQLKLLANAASKLHGTYAQMIDAGVGK